MNVNTIPQIYVTIARFDAVDDGGVILVSRDDAYPDPFVTWVFNKKGECCFGNYFRSLQLAKDNFMRRTERMLNVKCAMMHTEECT